MLQTDTTVKTSASRVDRYGGYSTEQRRNQTTQVEPEFKPFSYGTEEPSIESETAFEVEKQYNFDMGPYADASKEQAKVMEIPTLERRQRIQTEATTKTYSRAKLNARGKIMVAVYSIIVAIIVAFCIYNAVAISGLESDIVTKNGIVATQTEVITELENTYNSLGEEDNIISQVGDEFRSPTDSDIVALDSFEMSVREQAESQSNWFERFCEKLRKLFS